MYELSPDSRSVSSCSNGRNTDELPVTQRESFKRVRRGFGEAGFFLSGTRRVSEREREGGGGGGGSTDRQNWRLLDCDQDFEKFALTASAFRPVSGDFQSSGKGHSYKNWWGLATILLRVRTLPELLPICHGYNLQNLKTTWSIFVIDHSIQSLCNEQDTCHSHFLSTARMRLSTPLESLRWCCHGVASRYISLFKWCW